MRATAVHLPVVDPRSGGVQTSGPQPMPRLVIASPAQLAATVGCA
jgi:hypothetical protein